MCVKKTSFLIFVRSILNFFAGRAALSKYVVIKERAMTCGKVSSNLFKTSGKSLKLVVNQTHIYLKILYLFNSFLKICKKRANAV
jgi:hypothetical protein